MLLAPSWQQGPHRKEDSQRRRGVSSSDPGLEGSLGVTADLKGTQQVLRGSVQLGTGGVITADGSHLKSSWKSFLFFPSGFKVSGLISQGDTWLLSVLTEREEELEREVQSSFVSP